MPLVFTFIKNLNRSLITRENPAQNNLTGFTLFKKFSFTEPDPFCTESPACSGLIEIEANLCFLLAQHIVSENT